MVLCFGRGDVVAPVGNAYSSKETCCIRTGSDIYFAPPSFGCFHLPVYEHYWITALTLRTSAPHGGHYEHVVGHYLLHNALGVGVRVGLEIIYFFMSSTAHGEGSPTGGGSKADVAGQTTPKSTGGGGKASKKQKR